MGETEDLILGLYGAFRRQDLAALAAGLHPDVRFHPVPSAPTYCGREETLRFFEHDIHDLAEFDFRVIAVHENGDRALIHGKNRIRGSGTVRDAPIYWVSEMREGMMISFEPYTEIEPATAAFEAL